jgi:putative nucleotidyltransferase with HDIG domain
MKKRKIILKSFRTRVTLLLILSMLFVMVLSNFLVYKFTLNAQLNQLRERLMVIASTASLMVDADQLLQIPLNRDGVETPQYKSIADKLDKIKAVNPSLKYIYTMTKTDKEGIWQFIVDPVAAVEEGRKRGPTSYPGDKYYVSRFPEMVKGFREPSADKKLMADEWGVTLSGYAPIRDKNNRPVAILGVDMSAEDVYKTEREVLARAIFVLAIGVFMSIALGLLISRRITRRIARLVEGTRRIAAEDFDYKVEVRGEDEISELARSFNKMAAGLAESKKKLQDYFYRVVQSLVRILEAKDPYTRGHSERVADYAQAIALSMGFSKEKSELLKKAAELHDIGKLVTQESILNKKSKLTAEEWESMKKHPVIGEEVLKPVLLDEDVLAIIRSHHERYDGHGYPDGIKGDNINIFAQIISVADTYDAMTSLRPYRQALSKEEAIEELKRNCGTQFNTQIVKAFLKVLEKKHALPPV